MSIVVDGVTTSVGWFVPLFVLVLIVAVMSKSLLANVGLMVVCVLGVNFALSLAGVGEVVQYGLAVVFFCVIGFSLFQLLSKVEHL